MPTVVFDTLLIKNGCISYKGSTFPMFSRFHTVDSTLQIDVLGKETTFFNKNNNVNFAKKLISINGKTQVVYIYTTTTDDICDMKGEVLYQLFYTKEDGVIFRGMTGRCNIAYELVCEQIEYDRDSSAFKYYGYGILKRFNDSK